MNGYTLYTTGGERNGVTRATVNMAVNEPGSLSFNYKPYPGTKMTVQPYTSCAAAYANGKCIFAGRVTNCTEDIYGNISVDCEGALAALNDVVVPYRKGLYEKVSDLLDAIQKNYRVVAENSNIQINAGSYADEPLEIVVKKNTIIDGEEQEEPKEPLTYRKGYELLKEKVLDTRSSCVYPSYMYDGQSNKVYVSATFIGHQKGAVLSDTQRPFYTGVNIIDLSSDWAKWNPYSGVLPVGKDGLTIGSDDESEPEYMLSYDDVVWSSKLESAFGPIVKVVEFSEVEEKEDLLNLGKLYLNIYGLNPGLKYTVTAVEPSDIYENISGASEIGDIGVVNDYAAPILAIKYDLLSVDKNEYTIGPYVPEGILNEDITYIK